MRRTSYLVLLAAGLAVHAQSPQQGKGARTAPPTREGTRQTGPASSLRFARSPEKRIDALLQSHTGARRAAWGIRVVQLSTGKTVYDRQGSHWFVPASNAKLFSTSLGLSRLGPDHRFRTTVLATATPDAAGMVSGNLVLLGSGDPSMFSRTIPYQQDDPQRWRGRPLAALESLADQIVQRGVRTVEGSVVGDDTLYVWEPYPDGWGVDDPLYEYGAPVSALSVNDNCFLLRIGPGQSAGEPAELDLTPPVEHYIIHNLVRTGPRERIQASREPGSRELVLRGAIPEGGDARERILAIDDPAEYAARALTAMLRDRGVSVRGEPLARHRMEDEPFQPPNGLELAGHTSIPLLETLRIINKVSQNLEAELVLRAAGYARRKEGTRQAALDELKAFLKEAGISDDGYNFEDGSGLSRLNLVSPEAITKLLVYMHKSPHRAAWLSLLPIGGEDGTLHTRFGKAPGGKSVRAKTGTLSHVSCLSGYIESKRRGRLAFSIMVNNYNIPSSVIRGLIDKICLFLVEL